MFSVKHFDIMRPIKKLMDIGAEGVKEENWTE